MQIGFVTNCLGATTITEAVQVAVELDFDCLQVGPSVKRDREAFRAVQRNGPVSIHSFIYGRNFLSHQAQEREEYRTEIARLLELAIDLDVRQITTSTGVDPQLNLDDNIRTALEFWGPFFDQAQEAGVRIALEFCPTAGNFALGPYAWRRLLTATEPWLNFGLNYDPSHLLWQFIDPYVPIAEFGKYIFSAHAKDTIVWHDRLTEHGILTPYARSEAMAHGTHEARALWWEYRLPGEGELDWLRLLGNLRQAGYTGALLIEHEDARYTGSRGAVLEGLRIGLANLRAACQQLEQNIMKE
jgi:sugar phosphate isomerase/epimerase